MEKSSPGERGESGYSLMSGLSSGLFPYGIVAKYGKRTYDI